MDKTSIEKIIFVIAVIIAIIVIPRFAFQQRDENRELLDERFPVEEEFFMPKKKQDSSTSRIRKIKFEAVGLRSPMQSYIMSKEKEPKSILAPSVSFEMSPKSLAALDLTVQGIIWGEGKPQAIINNSVVEIGEKINGAEIVEIDKDGVRVMYGAQVIYLK